MTRIEPLPRVSARVALAALAFGPFALAAAPAAAQGIAREVVQPLPDPATETLNQALRALSRDPQSLSALVDAGRASLRLDNVDAALGFFRRAEAVAPFDGRVKAGLASVLVRQQQPVEALRLYAEAENAGEPMAAHAAERGLAYDLVGDNARAQQDYLVALAQGENPAVSRRLAISQAISGDQRGSEATLLPMLQRSDLAAFRTRAFALAILGKADEAVSIAETMLPARLSSRMSPYLRFMPRLSRSQQAAAANLGVFPQSAEIGRDDPALAAYSGPRQPVVRAATSADARLVPSGEPLGRRAEGGIPTREDVPQAVPPQPQPVLVEQQPAAVVVAAAPPPAADPQPSFSIAPPPEPQPPVQVVDLAAAFADFSLPGAAVAPAPGAVDITSIEPRREEPKPEPVARPTPPPPAHPSRHWVQVATGRDEAALAFDWRRIKRSAGGLLDRNEPYIAAWGQTNRLVAGPFASANEAQAMVGKLKEKNLDSFRFVSSRGEEVRPLD
jgi:Flp pilus assembly protein TadD